MNDQSTQSNGIGTAGFILALVTLFFGWIPFLGWTIWILGLVFSAVGIARAKSVGKGMGLSVAGLVISLLGVIMLIFVVGAIATAIGFAL
ncbi:MAG: hypothetical protein JXA77_18550 [Bacteroidales bacterium]|nr:hypothetical protein [Bacteroidales bacterium]MBN2818187.1 hypothetical protein [Bacteroidales bacterium]